MNKNIFFQKVHKGPMAYAEAFLEPNDFNGEYSKELKKEFKTVFRRLIDLYQKGIDQYGQLANKFNQVNGEEANTHRSMSISSNSNNHPPANKYSEMHRLLQEKFNEVENSFRNLLLIDGVSQNKIFTL